MNTILIAGSGSAVGRELSRIARSQRWTSIGIGLDEAGRDDYDALFTADLSVSAEADRVVETVSQQFGALDVMALLAGSMVIERAEDTTDEQWRHSFAACVDTVFFPVRAALRKGLLGEGSAVVATSSVNALLASPGVAAYAAAKSAVEGLMRQLALDNAVYGIRFNTVAPGRLGFVSGEPAGGYPRGVTISAQEVASAIWFLGSPAASGITGSCVPIDAGLTSANPSTFVRDDLRARLQRKS